MSTAVQRRRGTNTEHDSFTGLEGEISVNTTNESVHVHDGSTAGGFEMARADMDNVANIDDTIIGATTPAAGTFTSVAIGSSPATAGAIRLENNQPINARNAADSSNVNLLYLNASDDAVIGVDLTVPNNDFVVGNTTAGAASAATLYADGKGQFSTGSSGASAHPNGDDLVVEASSCGASLLSTDANTSRMIFGSPSENQGLIVDWTYDSGAARIRSNKVGATLALSADDTVTNLTLSGASGSELATFAGDVVVNGNVGIGTSSPSSLLHLSSAGSTVLNVEATGANDSRLRITSGNSNTSYVEFADPDDVDTGEIRYEHATNNMQFRTAGNVERMRIDSSGNVLVGCTGQTNDAPNVDGSFKAGGGNFKIRKGTDGWQWFQFYGTGTSSPIGSISNSGNTGVAYNTSSDQRLKDNIVDAEDAGELIDAIQVRQFDWIADGSHQDYGMVAQELQAVAPEAVSAPEDPDEMMGVDYSKLVPMLVKEIQSLRNRVAQLENN